MLVFIFVGVLTFASFGAEAQQLPHAAPVPQQILIGKRAFVSNAGADNVLLSYVKRFTGSPAGLYDKFYAAMQTWGEIRTGSYGQ